MEHMAASELLTDALFALDEPWRSRFLSLVANMATSGTWRGNAPKRDDIVYWLSTDQALFRRTERLLTAWRDPVVMAV